MSLSNSVSSSLPACTVYVVDDDTDIRRSTCFMVETLGHPCVSFHLAADFFNRAADLAPGCVLLDARLKGYAISRFQADLSRLPGNWTLVLMSGSEADASVKAALEDGASAFLEKPFPEQELVNAMQPGAKPSPPGGDGGIPSVSLAA